MPDFVLETFSQRIGETFRVDAGSEKPYEIEIVEARGMPGQSDAREPFSVLFSGTANFILEQRTYTLAHDELEPMDLFLVPLGPDRDRDGAMIYEAAFS